MNQKLNYVLTASIIAIAALCFSPASLAEDLTEWRKLNNEAMAAINDRNYAEGLRLAQECLKAAQKSAPSKIGVCYNNIALVYQEMRQSDKAEEAYKASIDYEKKMFGLNPRMAAKFTNLAVLYEQMGKVAEAEANYKEAIAIMQNAPKSSDYPTHKEALQNYAKMLRKANRTEEANKIDQKASTLD